MARTAISTPRVKIGQKPKQATRKALGIPIAQFLIDVLQMRRRFSAVSIFKGKNSTFSVIDLCVGILAIIILECERLSHVDDQSIKLVFDQHYKFTRTYVYLFQRLNVKIR